MPKYTDEDIRNMSKITCKIAADYLGISPMAVSIGMRNDLLPIGFAIHNEERDRAYSESWSYHIIGERLIAYKYGKTSEVREESERKRVEEARCREENRQRKEQEIRLVKELVNKAEDYRIAKEIREYIQAMIDSGNEDITPEWIEWALKKADWYDPSIETEDEYLGKRQHEKSAEEKEKSLQDSIRKSWYW